ncbi:MAG: S26 family signal peptidase [Candidatus Thermoplasmatota archaeon]
MGRLDGLKERAPRLHRFLTRRDRPWPLLRELLGGALALLLLVSILYGATGQPLAGGYPVVVVTSGSMMHCGNDDANGVGPSLGKDCDATSFGRIGTIDPGDLVFVRAVGERDDVTTLAAAERSSYGLEGDVVVYRPNDSDLTPIIHRALFWLQVNTDGTYTIPELDLADLRDSDLGHPAIVRLTRCELRPAGPHGPLTPADSGFITKGDNNPYADQCPAGQLSGPVQVDWVLGKARGELPWIGHVKLFVDDLSCNNVNRPCNFANAAGDTKLLMGFVLAVLLGGPWVVERVMKARRKSAEPPQP